MTPDAAIASSRARLGYVSAAGINAPLGLLVQVLLDGATGVTLTEPLLTLAPPDVMVS